MAATNLGTFDVIYADPCWSYSKVPYFKKSLAVQYQYETLSDKELCLLDVGSLANKNCWLFVWAVWAQLQQALDCIEAWEFDFKTAAFVWTKRTKNGKKAKGYGRCCSQGSTEVVLVGKRGSPARHSQNEEQEFDALMLGHSRKPTVVYDKISRIVEVPEAPVRKIELFARQQWPGWYAVGNDDALKDNPMAWHGNIKEIVGMRNE